MIMVSIATTPREASDSEKNGGRDFQQWKTDIKAWKNWTKEHFQNLPATYNIVRFIVVMPTNPHDNARMVLNELFPGDDPKYRWYFMEPGFLGAGDTFRAACYFAFRDDPEVEYVLHVPIDLNLYIKDEHDVEHGMTHDEAREFDDVQIHIADPYKGITPACGRCAPYSEAGSGDR